MEMTPAANPALVYSPHPLLAAAGRRLGYAEFRAGESVADYLARGGINFGAQPVVLYLNDELVPRLAWGLKFPQPGDIITVRAIVQGGGGGKNPLRTLLSIAVMVMAPQLALMIPGASTAIGIGTLTWGTVYGGIISIAGNLLISALLPPPAPNLSRQDKSSPTYALTGGSNRARLYEPMPLVLGRHRIYPDYGAKYYTDFEGDDQYLYQVFHFGLSDVVLSDFKIGATPIANFQNVEIQESGADGALTLFPANVDTANGGALTSAVGWIQRTSSINATALAVDIVGSLFYSGNSGITSRSATIEMEYRAVGAGSWLPFSGSSASIVLSSASTKPLRLAYRRNVAQGQYEVRVRRVTADETDAQAVSELSWSQLRTYQPDLADYTGQKRVAVRIKASGQLQGQIEQFNAIASAKCPVWNGAAWVTQETSNPAWWLLWFARGKKINSRRVFGADLADARIDIEGIKEFAVFCTAKNLTFNAVLDRAQTCADILNIIARVGRGFPTWATGKLGVTWEAANQPSVAVFGMGNIRRGSFQVEYLTEKLADEIVVSFINPDLDWQQDTVRALTPGVTTPSATAPVELFGCTGKDHAGREALLLAARQKYHRRRITWETDFEGMVVQRGDVAVLSHDLTQWGYSGRLVAGTTASLTLERLVPFTPALQHYVGITFPNGYFAILKCAYVAGESDVLTLTDPWPTQDELGNPLYAPSSDPNHPPCDYKFLFDPKATPGKRVRITGVQPLDEHYVRLTATDEDDNYYLHESAAYTYVAPVRTNWSAPPVLSNLQISEELVRIGTGWAVRLTLTWDASGVYTGATVRVGVNGGALRDDGDTTARRYEFNVSDGAVVQIEIYGYGSLSQLGPSSRLGTTYTVLGAAANPPPDVPWFLLDGRRLTWGEVDVPDLDGYEIKFHYGVNRDFDTANLLHDGVLTESPYNMAALPDKQVTLLIKARDTAGLYSPNVAAIITNFGDVPVTNVVETFDLRALGWPGTVTGGAVDGAGDLVATDTGLFFKTADSEVFYKLYDSINFYDDSIYSKMIYESGWVQPSKAAVGSAMTLPRTILGDGIAIEYRPVGPTTFYKDVATEPFYAADGDAFYAPPSDYAGWPGSIMATGQPYQFRVTTGNSFTRGKISALTPTIDAPDIEERFNDLVIASGGTRLPLTKLYSVIKTVNLTLQADGGTATRVRVTDKNQTLGPLIEADANGTPTTAKIDALIQGY